MIKLVQGKTFISFVAPHVTISLVYKRAKLLWQVAGCLSG